MFRSKCRREWLPSSNVKGVVHRLYRLEGFNHAFGVFSKYLPQGHPQDWIVQKSPKRFGVVLAECRSVERGNHGCDRLPRVRTSEGQYQSHR